MPPDDVIRTPESLADALRDAAPGSAVWIWHELWHQLVSQGSPNALTPRARPDVRLCVAFPPADTYEGKAARLRMQHGPPPTVLADVIDYRHADEPVHWTEQIDRTCAHEAAHAVVSVVAGYRFDSVAVAGDMGVADGFAGGVRGRPERTDKARTHHEDAAAQSRITALLAGLAWDGMQGHAEPSPMHENTDVLQAWAATGALMVHLDEAERVACLVWHYQRARAILRAYEPHVHAVADQLLDDSHALTELDVKRIIRRVTRKQAAAGRAARGEDA